MVRATASEPLARNRSTFVRIDPGTRRTRSVTATGIICARRRARAAGIRFSATGRGFALTAIEQRLADLDSTPCIGCRSPGDRLNQRDGRAVTSYGRHAAVASIAGRPPRSDARCDDCSEVEAPPHVGGATDDLRDRLIGKSLDRRRQVFGVDIQIGKARERLGELAKFRNECHISTISRSTKIRTKIRESCG